MVVITHQHYQQSQVISPSEKETTSEAARPRKLSKFTKLLKEKCSKIASNISKVFKKESPKKQEPPCMQLVLYADHERSREYFNNQIQASILQNKALVVDMKLIEQMTQHHQPNIDRMLPAPEKSETALALIYQHPMLYELYQPRFILWKSFALENTKYREEEEHASVTFDNTSTA